MPGPGLAAETVDARDYLENCAGQFQLIVAIDVLEHLTREDGLMLLEGVQRALGPGGTVILQVPNLASPFGGAIYFGDLTHRTGFTETSIRQLLGLAGFSQVEVRPAGPGLWSIKSGVRYLLWLLVKLLVRLWHVIECGNTGPSALTRVLLARGRALPGRGDIMPLNLDIIATGLMALAVWGFVWRRSSNGPLGLDLSHRLVRPRGYDVLYRPLTLFSVSSLVFPCVPIF